MKQVRVLDTPANLAERLTNESLAALPEARIINAFAKTHGDTNHMIIVIEYSARETAPAYSESNGGGFTKG